MLMAVDLAEVMHTALVNQGFSGSFFRLSIQPSEADS